MCFAIICAWTGERELALGQLEAFTKAPGSYTYGNLRLSPLWDPLARRSALRKNRRLSRAERNGFQVRVRLRIFYSEQRSRNDSESSRATCRNCR